MTTRNIYYHDPDLFKSQKIVDKYVDIFAYTFGVPRAALNVVGAPSPCLIFKESRQVPKTAAAKGLVVGDFRWRYQNGSSSTPELNIKVYFLSTHIASGLS